MLSWRAFPYVLSSLCNWSRMQQPEWSLMSQKSSPYPSLHQVTLATHSRSYQIQGTDVCLQDNNWRCTNIPKLASANVGALQKLAFCKWMTPCGAIPKRYKITLTDLFLDCAQLVEWPLDLNSLKMCFFLLVLWSILICWKMWDKIVTIKRTNDLNYFSLCAFNLFNTQVSQFELNYWNKLTFPWHSSLLRCTCRCMLRCLWYPTILCIPLHDGWAKK